MSGLPFCGERETGGGGGRPTDRKTDRQTDRDRETKRNGQIYAGYNYVTRQSSFIQTERQTMGRKRLRENYYD